MKLNTLTDVLADCLADLYDAERRLLGALPGVAAAAHAYELREALEGHLDETREHVARLNEIFGLMGIRFTPTKTCAPMEGLITDADEISASTGDAVALDAALIGAAQRIESFEITTYATARALAGELGLGDVKSLLEKTLGEEERAAKTLAKIAAGGMMSSGINRLAAERSAQAEADMQAQTEEEALALADGPEVVGER